MKLKLFILAVLFTQSSLANEDVCCIIGGPSGSGDTVQTFARIMSSLECKGGGNYQGKKICASIKDPENTYCGAESTYQDRCAKCGFFWSGKECLTVDPKEKAKKELEEEAKKKETEKGTTTKPASSAPAANTPSQVRPVDPDNPNVNNPIPEENDLFNRKSKGITEDSK